MRLDVYLTDRGLAHSRSEAQRAIREGHVMVGGQVCTKCAYDITEDTVEVTDSCRFVSRGGQKLQAAIDHFEISVVNAVCLDIGASTGGFTDCLLQNGAAYVYALENGVGQLHPDLMCNPCVLSMEQVNARYLTRDMFDRDISVVTIDVSFISQKLILPTVANVIARGGKLVSLIKPQFEVGRSAVGKGGIVKDASKRSAAVQEVVSFAESLGFKAAGVMESPIKGGDGNIEYLAYFEF